MSGLLFIMNVVMVYAGKNAVLYVVGILELVDHRNGPTIRHGFRQRGAWPIHRLCKRCQQIVDGHFVPGFFVLLHQVGDTGEYLMPEVGRGGVDTGMNLVDQIQGGVFRKSTALFYSTRPEKSAE